MIVLFFSQASFDKALHIRTVVKLSRPDVGSSSRSTLGSVIISTPIAVRFLSPPEIVFFITEPHGVS